MTRTIPFGVIACVVLIGTMACGTASTGSPASPTLAVQSATGAASGAAAGTTTSAPSASAGASSSSGTSASSESHDEREIEGIVTAIPPTTAAGQFTVGTTTIITTTATVLTLNGHTGLFTDLVVGSRVHVKGLSGAPSSTGGTTNAVTATRVMIQIDTPRPPSASDDDDDDDDDDHDGDDDGSHTGQVELRGTVSAVTGACPVLRFTVAGATVVTTAATRFDLACTAVVTTRAIEVKGTRAADGTVTATRIKRD